LQICSIKLEAPKLAVGGCKHGGIEKMPLDFIVVIN